MVSLLRLLSSIRSFGVQTMRERAESVSGMLKIDSQPGQWYTGGMQPALHESGKLTQTKCDHAMNNEMSVYP